MEVDYWGAIMALIAVWVELSLWNAVCASTLTTDLWPSFLGPILNFVSAQTLFGSTMRGFVIELCSALVWRNFNATLYHRARSMTTYTVMLLWAWTYNKPGPKFDSFRGTMVVLSALLSGRHMVAINCWVSGRSRITVLLRQKSPLAAARRTL